MALYDQDGTTVHIKRGGEVRVTASTKVVIDAPVVELEGDLRVKGEVYFDQAGLPWTASELRAKFNQHTHVENDSTTDPPQQQL